MIDTEYKADSLVYEVDHKRYTKGDVLWYFIEKENKTSISICWVNRESKADLTVCFVDRERQTKWNKPHNYNTGFRKHNVNINLD